MPIEMTCTIFVYKAVRDLSERRLDQLLRPEAENCTFLRQPGFWTHHVRAHKVEARDDFVLMLIDSVEMDSNVDIARLVAIARASCLHLASPACPSCNTKVLIRPNRSYVTNHTCGRLVEYVDAQLTLISLSAFACWHRLIDLIGLETDPYGWASWNILPKYCAHMQGTAFLTGIVDTMTVEKRMSSKGAGSKATYDWANASRGAAAAFSKLAVVTPWLRGTDVTRIIAPLPRPHAVHSECAEPQLMPTDAVAAATSAAATKPQPLTSPCSSQDRSAVQLPTLNGSSFDAAAACQLFDTTPSPYTHLAALRNLAVHASSSAELLLAASPSERLPIGSENNCSSLHRVVLFLHSCRAPPSSCGVGTSRLLAELPPLQPSRTCKDLLNFRGNGPEDPRILPLWRGDAGQTQLLVVVNDYWPVRRRGPEPVGQPVSDLVGSTLSFEKRMVSYVLSITNDAVAKLEPGRVLQPDPTLPPRGALSLSAIEKNWAPFVLDHQVFVHQWLISPEGQSVAHRVDIRTGYLVETHVSPSGSALRRAISPQPNAVVSGGTPAILLDKRLCPQHKPCFLAIGHTMTSPCNDDSLRAKLLVDPGQTPPEWRRQYARLHPGEAPDSRDACFWLHSGFRAYAAFAYIFRAAPPFTMLAATREFHLEIGTSRIVPVATRCGYGSCNRQIEFPVGLSLDEARQALLLSWGWQDKASMLSVVPLLMLLNLTRPVHSRSRGEL